MSKVSLMEHMTSNLIYNRLFGTKAFTGTYKIQEVLNWEPIISLKNAFRQSIFKNSSIAVSWKRQIRLLERCMNIHGTEVYYEPCHFGTGLLLKNPKFSWKSVSVITQLVYRNLIILIIMEPIELTNIPFSDKPTLPYIKLLCPSLRFVRHKVVGRDRCVSFVQKAEDVYNQEPLLLQRRHK